MAQPFIIIMLLAIMTSLAVGLVFLYRDGGKSRRVLKALNLRVALSLSLLAMLLIGYALGFIKPHALLPVESGTPIKLNQAIK